MDNTCGQLWGSPFSTLDDQIVIRTSGNCIDHKNADPAISDTLCLNDTDFFYDNADITCVYNQAQDNSSQHDPTNKPNMTDLLNNAGIHLSSSTTTAGTPIAIGNQTFTPPLLNENTCTADYAANTGKCNGSDTSCRVCYSANDTGSDQTDKVVHDEGVGGDDILCFNQACGETSANASPPADYGELCGTGQVFNKWVCSSIPNSNYYYNPTAYNPLGALEMATTMVVHKIKDLILPRTRSATPQCESGQWACSDNSNIVMNLYQAALGGANMNDSTSGADAKGHNAAFTNDDPEEISDSAISVTTSQYFKDAEKSKDMSSDKLRLPPIYLVTCTADANKSLHFPCSDNSDGSVNLAIIKQDWLSGDGQNGYDSIGGDTAQGAYPSGHLSTTYNEDTINSPQLKPLFSSMLAVAYVILGPIAVLIGYHLLWAALTFRNSSALEDFGRMMLGVIAISLSFQIVSLLLGLTNLLNHGVIMLHQEIGYSNMLLNTISGTSRTAYILPGDTDTTSFRGIVQPIVRWGCTINTFIGILAKKFWTDIASFLPLLGPFIQLAGQISDAIDVFKHIGEFATLLLSISLCVQVYLRVLFINYYIVTTPVVFACWALPGGTGGKIFGEWLKGFLSVLLVQTIQLFILTTMPLLLPPLPSFVNEMAQTGIWGILDAFFRQLPAVLVLLVTTQVPKMMGTGVSRTLAQAGTLAASGVAAAAAAAYNVV
jgi:hypothetical protein